MVWKTEAAEKETEKVLEMRERAMECNDAPRERVLEHLRIENKPQKRRMAGEMLDWLNKRVKV